MFEQEDGVANPFGLEEAIGKLIPTNCKEEDGRKLGVVCQTPKNQKI
jgi:hypothetical protein